MGYPLFFNRGFVRGHSPYFCCMENTQPELLTDPGKLSYDRFREEVLNDYRIACISRETSLLGRKEVLGGKAKFGIFGDGKELAQVAMAALRGPSFDTLDFAPTVLERLGVPGRDELVKAQPLERVTQVARRLLPRRR